MYATAKLDIYFSGSISSQVKRGSEDDAALEVGLGLLELLPQVYVADDFCALDQLADKFVESAECSDDGAFVDVSGLVAHFLEAGTSAPEHCELHQIWLELRNVLLLVQWDFALEHDRGHSFCYLLHLLEGCVQARLFGDFDDALFAALAVRVDQAGKDGRCLEGIQLVEEAGEEHLGDHDLV